MSYSDRRILAVFAHPDDEAYGPGGTLAEHAIGGAHIRLVCFTCGEAGSLGVSKELDPGELCRRRTVELAGACESLGVRSHTIVGMPDGGLNKVDLDEGAQVVSRELSEFDPEVVLTFHRGGVSGHPDHIAVSEFVKQAFRTAGEGAPPRLFGWGIAASRAETYQTNRKIYPTDDAEIAAEIVVSDTAMDRKIEAIHRHETQLEFFSNLSEWFDDYREASRHEHFTLEMSSRPRPPRKLENFFEGLD